MIRITREKVLSVLDALEKGEVRVAYKENGEWKIATVKYIWIN